MSKPQKLKPVPRFRTEAQERKFWESNDSAGFVDWRQAQATVFPDLKPSTETISLRLPASLLAELKALANQRDVPYQSLLKIFLAERIVAERDRAISGGHRLETAGRVSEPGGSRRRQAPRR